MKNKDQQTNKTCSWLTFNNSSRLRAAERLMSVGVAFYTQLACCCCCCQRALCGHTQLYTTWCNTAVDVNLRLLQLWPKMRRSDITDSCCRFWFNIEENSFQASAPHLTSAMKANSKGKKISTLSGLLLLWLHFQSNISMQCLLFIYFVLS